MKILLQQLNQRPIVYYPIYRNITGSTTAGILLSQLMYWFSKKQKIYKTDMEIKEETSLTDNELRSAKKVIKNLSFVEVTKEGIPAKTFYKIDWEKYKATMIESSQNKFGEIHENTIVKSTQLNNLTSQDQSSEIHKTINDISFETTAENTIKTTAENTPLSFTSSFAKNNLQIKETSIPIDVIEKFIEHRIEIKAPMNQKALDVFIDKLERLSEKDNPSELVNEAIINGWKSVFPLRNYKGASKINYKDKTNMTIKSVFEEYNIGNFLDDKGFVQEKNYIEGEVL